MAEIGAPNKISDALTEREMEILQQIIEGLSNKEIAQRLRFLVDVGLDYLTLDRSAETLSGGEAQRIRLATQIGSQLTGVLYILDEPSIGLHQRDNRRLLTTLRRLRDLAARGEQRIFAGLDLTLGEVPVAVAAQQKATPLPVEPPQHDHSGRAALGSGQPGLRFRWIGAHRSCFRRCLIRRPGGAKLDLRSTARPGPITPSPRESTPPVCS